MKIKNDQLLKKNVFDTFMFFITANKDIT